MDISLLVSLLAPCLPGLMGLGKKAAEMAVEKAGEKMGEKVGEQSAVQAGKIWQRLWPRVQAKEAAKEAAEDVAKDPADEESRVVLKKQLGKILESDQALAAEVAALLKVAEADPQGTWIQQSVNGDGNQVIGRMEGNAKAINTVTGNVTM
ncbi:MAG: hypothetical protein WBD47_18560 [Phormidesmis sp.]